MYIKIPLLAAVFVAAPWLMYQAWAFVAPGLYRRERRWAAPFILSTAALFILGGVFGYFVALEFALAFLVGMSLEMGISAYVGVSSYFDNFVNIMLGLGLVFQMPILIFFLTLLRITSPGFLLKNVRYAVLVIFVLAAIVTPTPDVVNMMIFAGPMILLFYLGVGASYLLVLHREKRSLPWKWIILVLLGVALLIGGIFYFMHTQFGYQFVRQAPFFVRPPAP
jgi:sec-independent protein translocase protein TatC